eukprot:PhF_6_TR36335/c0_g2_i2/m.53219
MMLATSPRRVPCFARTPPTDPLPSFPSSPRLSAPILPPVRNCFHNFTCVGSFTTTPCRRCAHPLPTCPISEEASVNTTSLLATGEALEDHAFPFILMIADSNTFSSNTFGRHPDPYDLNTWMILL